METDHFIFARLEEFFCETVDPWGAGFKMNMVRDESIEPVPHAYSAAVDEATAKQMRPGSDLWTPELHAGRIKYLMTSEKDLETPIEIDSHCDRGHIYAEPVMIDGWHRYMAHRALRSETIPVSFSGLVSFAEYLRGDTDERPE